MKNIAKRLPLQTVRTCRGGEILVEPITLPAEIHWAWPGSISVAFALIG